MDKILLIDDDESFLELAKKYLETEDFEVMCANCGEDGMNLVEEENPNLVLLDVAMPKLDGWDVYHQIKSMKPEVPISFLTSMEKLPSLDKYDIEDYIIKKKPLKESLVGRVKEILKD